MQERIILSEQLSNQVDQFLHLLKRYVKAVERGSRPEFQAEIKFMIKTSADQTDVTYSFTDKVTDDKGNEITDQAVLASLVKTVNSDNPDVITVTPGTDPSSGTVHWTGKTGVVGITASIAKPDGTILGSGGVSVTVVAGDPAAVTDIALKLGDLVDA
jgi:hypothetical protein